MRGRKPKPAGMRLAEGNPGKRPIPNTVKPTSKPKRPAHLDGDARKLFDRLAKELDELGVLTGIDVESLCAYCESWALYVEACKEIKSGGAVIPNDKGHIVKSPWVDVRNSQMDAMRKFASEFGLTPSSRSRIGVPGGAKDPAAEMAEFLAGGSDTPPMRIA